MPQVHASGPILIAGAGPVGLSLAVALTRQGIAVEVFEQDAVLPLEIRASTFHAATMEKMDDWGVISEVLAQGYRIDQLQFWDRSERRVVGDFDYRLIAGDTKFPFRLQCPQHVYAATLLRRLESEPLAKVHFGHQFVRSETSAAAVTAHFMTSAGPKAVSGALLCGADGAGSAVRRSLALAFDGLTYEDRFLLVATDLKLTDYYPGMGPVSYIFDPEEWVITLQLKSVLRLVFQVKEGQDAGAELEDDNIRRRTWKFLGQAAPFPILHKSIYRVHQRVAERFRVGRTLLLGDAAHINNPASGMGMNSGILDAACLADQIAAFLQTGHDEPLDVYDQLRRAYALDKIKSYTAQRYGDMSATADAARRQRNERYAALSRDPVAARQFLLQAAMLENRV